MFVVFRNIYSSLPLQDGYIVKIFGLISLIPCLVLMTTLRRKMTSNRKTKIITLSKHGMQRYRNLLQMEKRISETKDT